MYHLYTYICIEWIYKYTHQDHQEYVLVQVYKGLSLLSLKKYLNIIEYHVYYDIHLRCKKQGYLLNIKFTWIIT